MPFVDTRGLEVVERLPGWSPTDGHVIIVDYPRRHDFDAGMHGPAQGFRFRYCGTPSSAVPNAVASAIFAPLCALRLAM